MTKLTRSKERVADLGEVFTPGHIVDDMHKLIPEESWADPTMIYLEPTCGNGQFVVKAVEKKVEAGLTILQALNTTFGMDIMQDNIDECHQRLLGLVLSSLVKEVVARGSQAHLSTTARAMLIMAHNVFRVTDSLAFMRESKWEKYPFLFEDPTGEGQVLITEESAISLWKQGRCPRGARQVKVKAMRIRENWETGNDLFKGASHA